MLAVPSRSPHHRVNLLGSGSDYAPFVSKLGVTSIDMSYSFDPATGFSLYPLYHSGYDTFHLMETYYDPQFFVSCVVHNTFIFNLGAMVSHGAMGLFILYDFLLVFNISLPILRNLDFDHLRSFKVKCGSSP